MFNSKTCNLPQVAVSSEFTMAKRRLRLTSSPTIFRLLSIGPGPTWSSHSLDLTNRVFGVVSCLSPLNARARLGHLAEHCMKMWNAGANGLKTALTTLGLPGALTLASAQTISNPSFEANSFTNWPGYISSNSAIVGWTPFS
jgi:hypothetical protein